MTAKTASTSYAVVLGALSGWISHLVGIGCVFVLTPIIIESLGTTAYGIWSLIATVTSYYGLVDLGMGTATAKYFSQHVARKEEDEVANIAFSSLALYSKLSLLVLVLAGCFGILLPLVAPIESSLTTFFATTFLLGVNAAFQVMGTTFRSFLKARRAFTELNWIGIFSQLATSICIGVAVSNGGGFLQMSVILAFVGFVAFLITVGLATSRYSFPWDKRQAARKNQAKQLLKFGGLVVAARLVNKLSQKVGTLGALWLGGPALIAYFSIAEAVCEKCLAFTIPVREMVVPLSSALMNNSNTNAHQRLIVLAPRMFLTMGLGLMLLVLAYGEVFLGLWIGEEFSQNAWPVLMILALAVPLRALSNCLGLILQGMGEVKSVAKISVSEGCLLVVLAPVLGYLFGGTGLAWAVVTTTALTALVMAPYVLASMSEYTWHKLMLHLSTMPVAAVAIGGVVVLLLEYQGQSQSYFDLGLRGAVVSGSGLAASWFLCADSQLRNELKTAIAGKIPWLPLRSKPL